MAPYAAREETELTRQRAVAERLLLAALREQDRTQHANEAHQRAAFLAAASHDLAMSLDQDATRAIVRRRTLPREGSWCIVDVMEANGTIHRLAVMHPDPAKQELAATLAEQWFPLVVGSPIAPNMVRQGSWDPMVITRASGDALLAAAHGPANLRILEEVGFGALLVVPLTVRATVLGAITFVTRAGDPLFSPEEITLASDLADRCAMALDNARLYRETDALRASADVANRTKSTFLGNMSHELRTPLGAIGGYAELMEMGLRGPVTDEQRADLVRIQHNQRHLLGLIQGILDFVGTESGSLDYTYGYVPVQAALADVADMLTGAMKERALTLVVTPSETGVVIWADPGRVRQILANLMMNAVKYSRGVNGSITLNATVMRDTVGIHVTDDGMGIPPEKLETIFVPFVQLASGLTKRQGGIGLGLTISRDLARAMHGDLTVESTVGVGSRFTLTLPRTR